MRIFFYPDKQKVYPEKVFFFHLGGMGVCLSVEQSSTVPYFSSESVCAAAGLQTDGCFGTKYHASELTSQYCILMNGGELSFEKCQRGCFLLFNSK